MRFVRAYSLPDAGVRDWQDLGRSDCEHPQHKPAVHAFSTMMEAHTAGPHRWSHCAQILLHAGMR